MTILTPKIAAVSSFRRRAVRIGSYLVLLFGVMVLISTIRMVIQCWLPIPLEDQWDELVAGRTGLTAWLFSQHNEHRIFVPRIIYVIDSAIGHENNSINELSNLIAQAIFAFIMFFAGRFQAGAIDGRVRFGLALSFAFWAIQEQNFIWGFQIQFFGVVVGATAIFAVVTSRMRDIIKLPLLTLLLAMTAFMLASGIIACFISVLLSIYIYDRSRQTFILFGVAVALLFAYLHGYNAGEPTGVPRSLDTVLALLDYWLTYVGAVPAKCLSALLGVEAQSVARIAGVVAVIWSVALLVPSFRDRHDRTAAFYLALIAFVLAMAAVTAIGRARYGLWQALESRYTTPSSALWLALLLSTLRYGMLRGSSVSSIVVAIGVASVVTLTQPTFVAAAKSDSDLRATAMPAFMANVLDPDAPYPLYAPEHLRPFRYRSKLVNGHKSVFAKGWGTWLGDPLASHVALVNSDGCRGSAMTATEISSPDHGGWKTVGQVALASGTPDVHLLLADPGGRIVGYGITTQRLSGVSGTIDTPRDWVGAFQSESPDRVSAYALVDDHHACPLGGATDVVHAPVIDLSPIPPSPVIGGHVDGWIEGPQGEVFGWVMADNAGTNMVVHVDTNLPIRIDSVEGESRPDLAEDPALSAFVKSGFHFHYSIPPGVVMPHAAFLCIWTDDPNVGLRVLGGASAPLDCRPG